MDIIGGSVLQSRNSIRKAFTAITCLLAFSFTLQLVGFVSPGWMIFSAETLTVNVGLWYVRTCVLSECETKSVANMLKDSSSLTMQSMKEFQVETTIALITCFLATMLFIFGRRLLDRGNNQFKNMVVVGGFATLLSGILSVIAAGKMADQIRTASELLSNMTVENPFRFPYSLFLTGLGGILALVSCLMFLYTKAWNLSEDNLITRQFPVGTTPQYNAAHDMAYSVDAVPEVKGRKQTLH